MVWTLEQTDLAIESKCLHHAVLQPDRCPTCRYAVTFNKYREEIKAEKKRADAAEALSEDRRKARDIILGDVQELREAITTLQRELDKARAEIKANPYGELFKQMRMERDAAQREVDAFRKLLWLHHGCQPSGLYGDDGEMQCNNWTCLLDFKRQSPEEIEARWAAVALAALGKHGPVVADAKETLRYGTSTWLCKCGEQFSEYEQYLQHLAASAAPAAKTSET